MMRAIHLQIQQNFLLVLLLCVASILFSGCASTYGEKDLRSFEDDYGRSMPTSPQYKLEELSGEGTALRYTKAPHFFPLDTYVQNIYGRQQRLSLEIHVLALERK